MSSLVRFVVVVIATCGIAHVHAADFFFKDGDTVVMVGDSITEQHLYSNYVEIWTVTRYPKWKLTFRNVGISGDRSVGGNGRFSRDIASQKPTAITVDFGMNDGNYKPFSEGSFKPYLDGLQGMADQAKAANIRVAWVTPQPLDEGEQGSTALTGYNLTLEKFSEGVKTIAEKNGGLFVDQFHPYLSVLDKARSKGPRYDRITAGDAVHPGPPGQALMAASILKGLNFPTLVSSAEIDLAGAKVVDAKNCVIADLAVANDGVRFTRLDHSLPFFPPEASGILASAPILEELNDYRLKVSGLTAGKYELRVGGKKVGEWGHDQLAAGVNLAAAILANGPISDQVGAVKAAVEKKNRYYHDAIFRGMVLSPAPQWVYDLLPDLEAKRQALMKDRLSKMPALDEEVEKSLALTANQFELVPLK